MTVAVYTDADEMLQGEKEGDTMSTIQVFPLRKAVYIITEGDSLKLWLNKMKKLLQEYL